jgi:DNA-binding Lrp family transcriptional regulator
MKNNINNDMTVSEPIQTLNIDSQTLQDLKNSFRIVKPPKNYLTAVQIAKIVGVSQKAINTRIQKLTKVKKIRSVRAQLTNAIGANYYPLLYNVKDLIG